MKIGPVIINLQAYRVSRMSRQTRQTIDRLIKDETLIDAIRYYRKHVHNNFPIAKAYIHHRAKRLGIEPESKETKTRDALRSLKPRKR